MLNSSNNSEFYAHFSPRHSGKESSFVLLPYRSTKSIAQFIRKHSNSGHVGNISFHRQWICRILRSFSRPTFSIDTNSRIDFVDSLSNLVHCFNIMHPHQVKAEAVNMIFFYPIKNGLYHKLAHHRAFTCRLITASGTICQCPVFFLTIKITGNSTFKITFNGIKSMIINHIHYHTDTSSMQCLYHLFELFHTSGRLIRISWIRAIRHIIIRRIISPVIVVFFQFCFVDRSIIRGRKKMYMCHSQFYQVIDTGQ